MLIDKRYYVIDSIYNGTWSSVYKVRDIRDNKIYALKIFSKITPRDFYENFSSQKLYQLTKIKHPNLVRIYDFGVTNKEIYSLSEFSSYLSLTKFYFLNTKNIYKIIASICLGLNELHKLNILHSSLRPQNILYSPKDLSAKILDCSFANVALLKKDLDIDFLPYIAPEVYSGQKATPQSDLYSLGVILYYILTRTFPFSVSQIQNLKNVKNYFPTNPSIINPSVNLTLQSLVLRLLHKDPKERFAHATDIITFIKSNDHEFKITLPKIDRCPLIKTNQYVIRKTYLKALLENLHTVHNQKNGKILSITGDFGVGKSNLIRNFKYSILTDEYFIFHYRCSRQDKDPFFSIVKESLVKDVDNNVLDIIKKISPKYKEFLYSCETKSLKMSNDSPKDDMQFTKNYLLDLSQKKTLVLIIEKSKYFSDNTIEFLNFLSQEISNYPIFIILTSNKQGKLEKVLHKNNLFLSNLDYRQCKNYILQSTNSVIFEPVIKLIFEKSGGNPKFINQIIEKLLEDNLLSEKKAPKNFKLPLNLKRHIEKNVEENLSQQSYFDDLKILASIRVPLTSKFIESILTIDNQAVCFLLSKLLEAHILKRDQEFYHFSHKEIKKNLRNRLSQDKRKDLSEKTLNYFENKQIMTVKYSKGLSICSLILKKFPMARKFTLLAAKQYLENFEYKKAYLCYYQIVKLHQLKYLNNSSLLEDITNLVLNSKFFSLKSLTLLKKFSHLNINHLLGTLCQNLGEIERAEKYFDSPGSNNQYISKIILTKRIRNKILLQKLDHASILLNEFVPQTLKQKIYKNVLTAELLLKKQEPIKAIDLLQVFIENNNLEELKNSYVLAKLYETLANCLHIQRFLDKAEKYYNLSHDILKRNGYKTGLCNNYADLGGLNLTKGEITLALKNFAKAKKYSQGYPAGKLKVAYHYGKAYMKLGKFQKSILYFEKAKNLSKETNNEDRFIQSQMNIASAKMKIDSFGSFYQYIHNLQPEIFLWKIDRFNPLVRSFFVYLISIGQHKLLKEKLSKYSHIYFKNNRHLEHYYGLLGSIAYHEDDFVLANKYFNKAIDLVKNIHSYAYCILLHKLTVNLIAQRDFKKAKIKLKELLKITGKYKFTYWENHAFLEKIKIALFTGKISLREALRQTFRILEISIDKNYYIDILSSYQIIIQIYDFLDMKSLVQKYFALYKQKIDQVSKGLPLKDVAILKDKFSYFTTTFDILLVHKILPPVKPNIRNIQKEILDLLDIKEIQRVKFFIKKTIIAYFSPAKFFIRIKNGEFITFNITQEEMLEYENYKYISSISRIKQNNVILCPLDIKKSDKGLLVIIGDHQIPYRMKEVNFLKSLQSYLGYVIYQIDTMDSFLSKNILLDRLMSLNILSGDELTHVIKNILKFLIDITGAQRGFWIKKDYLDTPYGRNLWVFGIDEDGSFLSKQEMISNSVIDICQKRNTFYKISSSQVLDKTFVDLIERFDIPFFDILVCPIIINNRLVSFLYLDSFRSNNAQEHSHLSINDKFMQIFITYIGKMIETYNINQDSKKNKEIHSNSPKNNNNFLKVINSSFLEPIDKIQKLLESEDKSNLKKAQKKIILLEHSVKIASFTANLDKLRYKRVIKYNLKKLFDQTLLKYKPFINDIVIKYDFDIKDIRINKNTFLICLENIILNSLQHAKKQIVFGSRMAGFSNEMIKAKESIIIHFKNDGKMIPKKDLQGILNHKSSSKTKISTIAQKKSSLKMGLSLTENIIQKMEGKVWIESNIRSTTTFFSLPK